MQALDGRKSQRTDHREQFVKDTVQVDGRVAVEHIEAVERAVVIVEVRDEDGIPAQPAHGIEVEAHGRKRVAIAAERVFDDGVEGDGRAFAFEDIAGVQDAGDFQGHGKLRIPNGVNAGVRPGGSDPGTCFGGEDN